MNHLRFKKIIPKKYRKYLIGIILFSLVHNFIVFPAQAATTDYTENTATLIGQKVIIKKPLSQENRLEQLTQGQVVSKLPQAVIDFKLINTDAKPKSDFHIGLLEKAETTSLVPIKGSERLVSSTAYNSEVSQCDGDPCTTANGFNVCEHGIEDTVAANFLPFGTKIIMPELFGDRVFIVRDRMARRHTNRVDVWMLNRSDAIKFGIKQTKIIILED